MIACIGLIILVSSATRYNPSTATRELEEVIRLENLWSPRFLSIYGNVSLTRGSGAPIGLRVEPEGSELIGTLRSDKSTLRYSLIFPKDAWITDESFPLELTERATTLDQFETKWNSLTSPCTVIVPYNVCQPTIYLASKKATLSVERSSDKHYNRVEMDLRILADETTAFVADLDDGGIVVPVCFSNKVEFDQHSLSKAMPDWKPGKFKESFYDLDQATKELKALPFETVSKLLASDATKNSEVFEAFGVKFPAAQISIWGGLVICGIQLYFFIYLRDFAGKLRSDDPGWDVPWIAMVQTKLAQALTFITFFVLPMLAIIVLEEQAVLRLAQQPYATGFVRYSRVLSAVFMSNGWSRSKILAFYAALWLSWLLGFLCWKYRPRLIPAVPKNEESQWLPTS